MKRAAKAQERWEGGDGKKIGGFVDDSDGVIADCERAGGDSESVASSSGGDRGRGERRGASGGGAAADDTARGGMEGVYLLGVPAKAGVGETGEGIAAVRIGGGEHGVACGDGGSGDPGGVDDGDGRLEAGSGGDGDGGAGGVVGISDAVGRADVGASGGTAGKRGRRGKPAPFGHTDDREDVVKELPFEPGDSGGA